MQKIIAACLFIDMMVYLYEINKYIISGESI